MPQVRSTFNNLIRFLLLFIGPIKDFESYSARRGWRTVDFISLTYNHNVIFIYHRIYNNRFVPKDSEQNIKYQTIIFKIRLNKIYTRRTQQINIYHIDIFIGTKSKILNIFLTYRHLFYINYKYSQTSISGRA